MTERDLMRAVARGLSDRRGRGRMHDAGPETIGPDDTNEHGAVLMIHGGYRDLPVVDGDDVVGALSIRDLVQVVVEDSAPRGRERHRRVDAAKVRPRRSPQRA